VHMCIAIPPKHPVASVIGFLKGKSAIAITRLGGKEKTSQGSISGHAVTRCSHLVACRACSTARG
jgi:REP element-mobilizing transposase RayT